MTLEVGEYGRLVGVSMSRAEAEAMQASKAVTITPSIMHEGRWDLAASQWVGVVQAGNVELRIRPKVPVDRLLFLLSYARDDRGWSEDPADLTIEDDLVPSMANAAFAHHAEQALQRGVLQGYVVVEEALPAIRGRIREADQLRKRFGFLLPVEVRYDDYTVNVVENRLLLAASERLLRLPMVPSLVRRRLRHLRGQLDGVGPLRGPDVDQRITFTRLNVRYGPAISLAKAVLRGTSLEFGRGGRPGMAFLFDMNRVFEDFVTAVLSDELERFGGRVAAQDWHALDAASRIRFKPDLVWWGSSSSRCHAVIDIKYKATQVESVPNADVYQAMAYSLALDVRPAFLLYAAGNESPAEHHIVNSDLEVVARALDIAGEPDDILASVRQAAELIAAHAAAGPAAPKSSTTLHRVS